MSYSEWEVLSFDHRFVFIKDLNGPKSVTNDAENVVAEIAKKFGVKVRVVYLDSQDEWWEIGWAHGPAPGDWRIVFEKWHGFTWDKLKNAERYN